MVHTSSSAVFGVPAVNPVLPTTVPTPAEAYGHAKLAAEWACLDAVRRGLDVTIVRPRTVPYRDGGATTDTTGVAALAGAERPILDTRVLSACSTPNSELSEFCTAMATWLAKELSSFASSAENPASLLALFTSSTPITCLN